MTSAVNAQTLRVQPPGDSAELMIACPENFTLVLLTDLITFDSCFSNVVDESFRTIFSPSGLLGGRSRSRIDREMHELTKTVASSVE